MAENNTKVKIDIEVLKGFFFRGSINGYASGKEPKDIPIFPGAKGYFYAEWIEERLYKYRLYKYFDVYFSIGGGKSFGFTLISIDEQLVWYMRYDGACLQKFVGKQKTTDTLKKALLVGYQGKIFFGGRGIPGLRDENLEYINFHNPSQKDFEKFKGVEMINDITNVSPHSFRGNKVFQHEYEGGLISLK